MRWVITDSLPGSPAQAWICGEVGPVKLMPTFGSHAPAGTRIGTRKLLARRAAASIIVVCLTLGNVICGNFFIQFSFSFPSLCRSVGFGHDLRATVDSSKGSF
jgi:hypothetical protein